MIGKLDWLKADQREFLNGGYLDDGETPEQRFQTICDTVQKYATKLSYSYYASLEQDLTGEDFNNGFCPDYERVKGIGKRFERYFEKGWPSLSTPVLKNFGKEENLPISCNHGIIEDSLSGIYKGLHETGMLAKYGAGTAVNFSDIRPVGSNISTGGTSNTILDWIELYADMMSKTAQNRARRGFLTAYLSVDHPEIMDFLDIGTHRIPTDKQRFFQTITTAVTLPEGWRDDLKTNPAKRKIFTKILNTRKETGFPYILDETNCNKGICQAYIDKGMKIRSSNICVTGDQRVVTDRGYLTAKELYESNESVVVYNNEEAVLASPMQLIEKNAEVLEIVLDNGMTHKVTPYHKIKVKKTRNVDVAVEAQGLNIGDNVYIQSTKGLFGVKDSPKEAFMLGMWQSDGTSTNNGVSIQFDLWKNDYDLESEMQSIHNEMLDKYAHLYTKPYKNKGGNFIDVKTQTGKQEGKRRLTSSLYSKVFKFKKQEVPYWIFEGTEETQWQYLRGLLYADGTVFRSKKTNKLKNEVIQISYADTSKKFLQQLQLIFNNLGLRSSIKDLHKEGKKLLPDGKGGKKEYNCKKSYRLIVGNLNDALKIEKRTGFLSRKNIFVEDKIYRDNTKKTYKVVAVNRVENEDVYCLSIKGDNKYWICNGVMTHNCIEAMEYTDYDKTFACCLSAVNLYYYDEWKNDPDFIFDMNILLDCVIEEYIEKGSKLDGLEKAVRFAKEHRAIGLGTTAFSTYLQKNNIVFGSLQSYQKNNEIFSFLRKESDKASKWMAGQWGEPKVLEGYGERNTSRMAQAPKKSTTFIDGGTFLALSEGIGVHTSNYSEKKLAKIQVTFKNKELEKVLISKNKNTKKVWNSIADYNGSVQHLDFLSEHEKDVFKMASEVSQADVIKLAAQRQKYIDMGQSVNIMVHPDTPAKEVIKLHLMAFDEGLKSLYYQYSINAAQKFSQELMTCSVCEG